MIACEQEGGGYINSFLSILLIQEDHIMFNPFISSVKKNTNKVHFFDRISESRYGFLITLPSLLILLMVAVYPVLRVIYMSMTEFGITMQAKFVGPKNFFEIFTDINFFRYTRNSLIYTFGAVAISFTVGMIIALALNKNLRFTGFLRTIALWPWAIPPVVASITWKWMYNDVMGILNDLLLRCGLISQPLSWLSNGSLALASLLIVHAWIDIPFVIVLLLAGLKSIPQELYEAASIDGASNWKQFTKVTLPLLKPTMMVTLLISTAFAFRTFDIVFTLTRGGPGDATELLVTYIYNNAFQFLRFGYSSALSVIMVIITILIVLFYTKVFRTNYY